MQVAAQKSKHKWYPKRGAVYCLEDGARRHLDTYSRIACKLVRMCHPIIINSDTPGAVKISCHAIIMGARSH
jgi:hypothetical protein